MEWSKATVLQFIKEYENHSVLWDPRNEDRRNILKRKLAFEQLGQKFGLSTSKVKDKIANLKRQYNREIAKIEKNKKNGVVYTPRWFGFKYLRFLSKYNDKDKYDIDMVLFPEDDSEYNDNDTSDKMCYTSLFYDEGSEIEEVSNSVNNICSTTTKTDQEDIFNDSFEDANQSQENSSLQKDEFSVYGEHIAWQLRKFKNRQLAAKVRLKIEEVLFNAVNEDCNLYSLSSNLNPELNSIQKFDEHNTDVEVIKIMG